MSISEVLSRLRRSGDLGSPGPSERKNKRKSEVASVAEAALATPVGSPARLKRSQITPLSPATPDKPIPTPVLQGTQVEELESPMRYHHPDGLLEMAKTSKSEFKKLRKSLENGKRPVHTIVIGSAQKDPERIRRQKLQPNECGVIEVPSESGNGKRLWGMHRDGRKKIFPIKGKNGCGNVFPLDGAQLGLLIDEFQADKNAVPSQFEERLLQRLTPRSSPGPAAPPAAAADADADADVPARHLPDLEAFLPGARSSSRPTTSSWSDDE